VVGYLRTGTAGPLRLPSTCVRMVAGRIVCSSIELDLVFIPVYEDLAHGLHEREEMLRFIQTNSSSSNASIFFQIGVT
jgi:hypothetical protein